MQRPTSVTVFGVLNIVFGIFGVLSGILQLGIALAVQQRPDLMPNVEAIWNKWSIINLVLGWILTVLLLGSGIGLLRVRSWGRTMAFAYSVLSVAAVVFGVGVYWFTVAQPGMAQFDMLADDDQMQVVAGGIGAVFSGCIQLLYAGLLAYYMTRPHVTAAFLGVKPLERAPVWSQDSPFAPTPVDERNPYLTPQTVATPQYAPGAVSPAPDSIVETFIPSRNGPALAAYYLGIFSLFPCLGFFLAIPAVYFGIQGLRRVRENPAVRGGAHAWVGLICGCLFGLFNFFLLAAAIVGMIASAGR